MSRRRYVHQWIDNRHGKAKARFYFRRRGFKQVLLPGLPGSHEFERAYAEAITRELPPRAAGADKRIRAGSVDALVLMYFASPKFLNLAPATQMTYRGILNAFTKEHGAKPVASLATHHLEAMLAGKAKTPAAANHWLRLTKQLMRLAKRAGMRDDDPSRDIERLRHKTTGFHTWTEDEITQFESHHAIGSKPRLALALMLYFAQRRSDVVKMGPQHVRNGLAQVRHQKTGRMLTIPVHPDMQAVLDASAIGHLNFLTTAYGKPFTAAGFGNWFADRCDEAGLPHCRAHGLRKAQCRRLAEAGCSSKVIASISGHKSLREVERYVEAADQERMARQGMAAIVTARSGNGLSESGNGA